MKRTLLAALGCLACASVRAQPVVIDMTGEAPAAQGAAPAAVPGAAQAGAPKAANAAPPAPQQQMLDLSLLEALVAVGEQDLVGVFGYVPENAVAPAFADYLMRNSSALKKMMKKAKRDIKETGGINLFDRAVFLYVMQINGLPGLPPGVEKLSKSAEFDVSGFILAKPLTLQEMTQARGARR